MAAGEPINAWQAKLAAGGCTTCFMVTMPSVAMVQVLAASGVDGLILDMEHGAMDLAAVQAMVAATRGTGVTPVVRIPTSEPWLAKPVLGTGAMGINFPMVSTAAIARATVQAVRYPPHGARGYAPSLAPVRWGLTPPEYLACADREVMNLITIEDAEAIANLDAILAVPGIDVAAIASFDLSMSLGVPGQFDHPDVRALVAQAEATILRTGIPMGGVAMTAQAAAAKRAAGYRVLLVGSDAMMLGAAARAAVAFGRGAA